MHAWLPLLTLANATSYRITITSAKTVISATRVFAGGLPQTEVLTMTVDGFAMVTADAALFQRPAEYVNQKPLIGAPAR